MPTFADTNTRKTLQTYHPFWTILNETIKSQDAFLPVRLFKHGIQSLYSKTKGGVDGSAQARAILRSSTSTLKWEQKIVSQTFKTLAVNSFIAWRMTTRKDLLQSKETFQSVDCYRRNLNKIQSLADFVYDVSKELVLYSEKLKKEADSGGRDQIGAEAEVVAGQEASRLHSMAIQRKRKRLLLFKGAEGIKLRMQVRGHE